MAVADIKTGCVAVRRALADLKEVTLSPTEQVQLAKSTAADSLKYFREIAASEAAVHQDAAVMISSLAKTQLNLPTISGNIQNFADATQSFESICVAKYGTDPVS